MCTTQECFSRLEKAAPYIRDEFGVTSMCVFGSMARGDNRIDSDVDVCVEMPSKMFSLIGLKQFLQDLLGLPVDLVRRHNGMNQLLVSEIQRDGISIFP